MKNKCYFFFVSSTIGIQGHAGTAVVVNGAAGRKICCRLTSFYVEKEAEEGCCFLSMQLVCKGIEACFPFRPLLSSIRLCEEIHTSCSLTPSQMQILQLVIHYDSAALN